MARGAAERVSGSGHTTAVGGRKEEIVVKAAELFQEKGFGATSVQDIADRVGILKGSLYHYIHSKEEILFLIIDRTHRRFLELIRIVDEQDGTPLEKLRSLIDGHVHIATQHVVEALVYYQDFGSLGGRRRKVIVEQRNLYAHYIRDLITQAQAEGDLPAELSPNLAEIAIVSLLTTIPRWYRPEGEVTSDQLAHAFGGYAMRILTC